MENVIKYKKYLREDLQELTLAQFRRVGLYLTKNKELTEIDKKIILKEHSRLLKLAELKNKEQKGKK
jgi:hypothetical protein